ncbi:MAG: phage tail tape measure protein, partial [Micromonosporaceae bacterium]|nr:phage tail tape measure protein [Micromonosporaceae bacterium]
MLQLGELNVILGADDKPMLQGLDAAETRARQGGQAAGEGWGREYAGEVQRGAKRGASSGADAMRDGLGKFEGAGIAIGAAAGAALAVGVASAIDLSKAQAKFEAQIGDAGYAKDLGEVAGRLYTSGLGQSIDDNMTAVRAVISSGLVAEDAGADAIEDITSRAAGLAEVFGQDVTQASRAAGQMIRTGLASDANQAFDILTRGFQQTGDLADDLLDTFSEYSTQFRVLGVDGQTAMGLMSQGLHAGARDADTVADALKEFAIRAIDGSKTTAEGFKAIGLSARKMETEIGAGGERSAAALDLTLDRLRGMKDPVERNAAAVALFGTKAEDLGEALFSLDPSEAVAALGDVEGASGKMADTLEQSAGAKLDGFKRRVQQAFVEKLGQAVPHLEKVINFLREHKDVVTGVVIGLGVFAAAVGTARAAIAVYNGAMMIAKVSTAAWTAATKGAVAAKAAFTAATNAGIITQARSAAAMVASKAAMLASAVATNVAAAAQWLLNVAMSANPLGLIIIAVIALVGVFILLWNKCDWFRNFWIAAWDMIKGAIGAVWNWVKDNWPLLLAIITGPIGLAVLAITKNWDKIKAGATAVWHWITDKFTALISFVKGLPGKISKAASGMWDGVKNAFRSVINWIIRKWNGLSFSIPSVDMPGIGKVGGFTLSTPNIPELATGGDITRAGMAVVAERGPELITLPAGAQVRPLGRDSSGQATARVEGTVEVKATCPTCQIVHQRQYIAARGGNVQ